MNRIFFFFAFIILCTMGCKKEYPVSSVGTPVFYFNGTVNGSNENLQAGVNSYYMYSSFSQDSNLVYNFFAELKQTNCPNCANKIKFQINDFTTSTPNGSAQINTSLQIGYYALQMIDSMQSGAPTEYLVAFSAVPVLSDSIISYSWNFGDGTISLLANPTHTYSHPGNYDVCLTISYSSGCTSNSCNHISVGLSASTCTAMIIDTAFSGNIISFSGYGSGNSVSYLWDFGDGTTSTLNTDFVQHTYANAGIYNVCLQITDDSNCIANICKNVTTLNFGGCLTNFDFIVQGTNPNPLSLSNIIITWTDNSGIEYASNTGLQPGDSYFQIISVEDYSNNENNQPTKKLHVKFKCLLFNGGNSIPITNGDAVIAVSYR